MAVTRRYTAILFVFLTAILGMQRVALSEERGILVPPPTPQLLVRILELHGTGPDGNSRLLYASQDGYTTTLDALGRVGSQVNAEGLQEGAYHTLYVRLHDSYQRIAPDGRMTAGSFSGQDKPTLLRVRGMIMVRDGRATPLRMLDHNLHPSPRRGTEEWDDD
jgi:hypothetical protein